LPVPSVVQEVRNVEVDSNAFLVLRENFRKLKDHCQDLERKTKRERLVSQLFETRLPGGDKFHAKLAKKLQELTGIQSLALYTFSQFESTMVVRATSGDTSATIEDNSFNIDPTQATRQITDNVELTMRAMLDDTERSKVATILLQSESSVVGMINLFHADWDQLYEAKRLCEEVAGVIALLISEEHNRRSSEARIAELELLYEVVAVTSGAVSRKEIVERVVERLHHFIDADFIGGYFIEHGQAILSGFSGREMRILDMLSFANSPGLEGWLATGAPEVAVFRTSDDDRCDGRELLRRRIGSFLLIPLQYGEVPFGFVIAASRVSNGLDRQHLHTLRAVIAECSQAVSRLEQPTTGSRGLVSVTAFQMLASAGRQGCIVIMELLKKQDLLENCGATAVETAMRAFSLRINAKLPPGGAACQRKHGDFIVYLPGAPEDFARSWANDLAATASMIGVPTLGGRRSIPMAFRARVALVGQQSSEVLSAQAS